MRMHGDTKFLVGAACVYKYIYIERDREREENYGMRLGFPLTCTLPNVALNCYPPN